MSFHLNSRGRPYKDGRECTVCGPDHTAGRHAAMTKPGPCLRCGHPTREHVQPGEPMTERPGWFCNLCPCEATRSEAAGYEWAQ